MKIKSIKSFVKELAKREGKKRQVNIAQLEEIAGIVSDILFEDRKISFHQSDAVEVLVVNGEKRANARAKLDAKGSQKK